VEQAQVVAAKLRDPPVKQAPVETTNAVEADQAVAAPD